MRAFIFICVVLAVASAGILHDHSDGLLDSGLDLGGHDTGLEYSGLYGSSYGASYGYGDASLTSELYDGTDHGLSIGAGWHADSGLGLSGVTIGGAALGDAGLGSADLSLASSGSYAGGYASGFEDWC